MNKILTVALIVTSITFISCGGNDAPVVDKSIMPAGDINKIVPPPDTATGIGTVPATIGQQPAPGVVQAVPSPEVSRNAQTISATDASKAMPSAGLNPAHGAPGHRCDISVGAPLNSAPTSATTPAQPVQAVTAPAITAPASKMPAITSPASSPLPANPNAKLNPAHGQPGHDCAIAVGAPLKG